MKHITKNGQYTAVWLIFSALLLGVFCLVPHSRAAEFSPEGYWKTVPDDDANPALIKVWKENEEMVASIVRLF